MDDWSFAVLHALRDEHKRQKSKMAEEDLVLASFDLPQVSTCLTSLRDTLAYIGPNMHD